MNLDADPTAGLSPFLTYEPFYGLTGEAVQPRVGPGVLLQQRRASRRLRRAGAGIRRREGLIVLSGEIGTGKTTLCRAVLAQLDRKTLQHLRAGSVRHPRRPAEDARSSGSASPRWPTSTAAACRGVYARTSATRSTSSSTRSCRLQAFAVLVDRRRRRNLSLGVMEEIRILAELEAREAAAGGAGRAAGAARQPAAAADAAGRAAGHGALRAGAAPASPTSSNTSITGWRCRRARHRRLWRSPAARSRAVYLALGRRARLINLRLRSRAAARRFERGCKTDRSRHGDRGRRDLDLDERRAAWTCGRQPTCRGCRSRRPRPRESIAPAAPVAAPVAVAASRPQDRTNRSQRHPRPRAEPPVAAAGARQARWPSSTANPRVPRKTPRRRIARRPSAPPRGMRVTRWRAPSVWARAATRDCRRRRRARRAHRVQSDRARFVARPAVAAESDRGPAPRPRWPCRRAHGRTHRRARPRAGRLHRRWPRRSARRTADRAVADLTAAGVPRPLGRGAQRRRRSARSRSSSTATGRSRARSAWSTRLRSRGRPRRARLVLPAGAGRRATATAALR